MNDRPDSYDDFQRQREADDRAADAALLRYLQGLARVAPDAQTPKYGTQLRALLVHKLLAR